MEGMFSTGLPRLAFGTFIIIVHLRNTSGRLESKSVHNKWFWLCWFLSKISTICKFCKILPYTSFCSSMLGCFYSLLEEVSVKILIDQLTQSS